MDKMTNPCEFDHNGECLICDCFPSDCAWKRFLRKDYTYENHEQLFKMFIGVKFKVLGESGGKLIFVLKKVKDSPVFIYNFSEGKVYTSGLGLICPDMETLLLICKLLGFENMEEGDKNKC